MRLGFAFPSFCWALPVDVGCWWTDGSSDPVSVLLPPLLLLLNLLSHDYCLESTIGCTHFCHILSFLSPFCFSFPHVFRICFLHSLSPFSPHPCQAAVSMRSPVRLAKARRRVKMRTMKAVATPTASGVTRKASGRRHRVKQMKMTHQRATSRSQSRQTKTTPGLCSTEPCPAMGRGRRSPTPTLKRD